MATILKVVERDTGNEVNFYDASLAGARYWALDCKRHMKSLTGKEYDVVVKEESGEEMSLREYELKQNTESV
jgi:hypothetical protein